MLLGEVESHISGPIFFDGINGWRPVKMPCLMKQIRRDPIAFVCNRTARIELAAAQSDLKLIQTLEKECKAAIRLLDGLH